MYFRPIVKNDSGSILRLKERYAFVKGQAAGGGWIYQHVKEKPWTVEAKNYKDGDRLTFTATRGWTLAWKTHDVYLSCVVKDGKFFVTSCTNGLNSASFVLD